MNKKTMMWMTLGVIILAVIIYGVSQVSTDKTLTDTQDDTLSEEGRQLDSDNNIFDEIEETLDLLE